jgi:hypothetical protein
MSSEEPKAEKLSPGPILNVEPDAENPWTDKTSLQTKDETKEPVLKTIDPSIVDESIASEISAEPSIEPNLHLPASEDVLSEFDPLANQEEKEAREAWESSEAHPPPPPPRTPSPPPKSPIKDDLPDPPTSGTLPTSPSFPALAALARSFSIPGLARARPVSLDAAKAVPSPHTLSTFAAQQQDGESSGSGRATPARSDGDRSTDSNPSAGSDPPFDFQKFLDQMKLRGAEPVSKYLKSYVIASCPPFSG